MMPHYYAFFPWHARLNCVRTQTVFRQRLPVLRMTIVSTPRGGATCTDDGNVIISGRL